MEEPVLKSNDNVTLIPKTSFQGPCVKFNFPALHVGVAEYEEGPTGCTVFYFPERVDAAYDLGGGSPGTILTREIDKYDAICFAGGSFYGLEASSGVAAEILKRRGYSKGFGDIAIVPGAIVYDYMLRDNSIYPDKELGRAALKAAKTGVFPIGNRGAGRGATVGKIYGQLETSGQGCAFTGIGAVQVGVFTVTCAMGAIFDKNGKAFKGLPENWDNQSKNFTGCIAEKVAFEQKNRSLQENCTLTLVVTNQKLDSKELNYLAKQINCSLARFIHPFHTVDDGDSLFMVTTNEVSEPDISVTDIGLIASDLAWDAIARCFAREA